MLPIPWHRVRYIRCNETIVWDRENRIDLISTNSLPEIAWKSENTDTNRADLAALVANNQVQFSPRSIHYYEGTEWKIFTGGLKSIALDKQLTIVSYNILSNLLLKLNNCKLNGIANSTNVNFSLNQISI
jgi:poly(A) polymerase